MVRFSTFLVCISWMLPAVFLLRTDYKTDDGVANFLSVPAGSPFYLVEPELCQDIENRRYELHHKEDMIASCDHRICQTRFPFENRVTFIPENCTFVVKDTTLADADVYKLITLINENDKPKSYETTFSITVTDHASIPPAINVSLPHERVGNVTVNVLGFVYVCLSMAPLGNVICCLVHIFPFCQAIEKKNGACLFQAANFIKGDRCQTAVKKSLAISGIISLICQIISISLLPGRNDNPVYLIIAIVCLVIAALDNAQMVWPAFKGKQCPIFARCFSFWQNVTERIGSECKGWKYLCITSLVAQVAFAVCMMIHRHVTCLINCWRIDYLFVALAIFLAIHAILWLAAYFCSSPSQTHERKKSEESQLHDGDILPMMESYPLHDGDASTR